MLDTKGPEIRTVTFKEGEATLNEGAAFALYADEQEGDETGVSITYDSLYKDVVPGQVILLDDGLLALEVVGIENTTIHTKVLNGGVIKDHKGINVPGASIRLPALTEKDVEDIRFGIEEGVDFIAASFIRKKTTSSLFAMFWKATAAKALRSSRKSKTKRASTIWMKSPPLPTALWWPEATWAWKSKRSGCPWCRSN